MSICSGYGACGPASPSFFRNHLLLCLDSVSNDHPTVCLLHSRLEAAQHCAVSPGFAVCLRMVVRLLDCERFPLNNRRIRRTRARARSRVSAQQATSRVIACSPRSTIAERKQTDCP